MWTVLKRIAVVASIIGATLMWLSLNSIPTTLATADSHLAENLRYLGWENPPKALASTAADHWGVIIGTALVLSGVAVLLLWLTERRSPIRAVRLERAEDTPTQGNIALWLWITNHSRQRIEDVLATLVRIDPYPPAFPNQALPPIPLATKQCLEDYRAGHGPLYQGGFTLRPGQEKPIEVAWLPKTNALQWYVTRSIGDAEFLLDQNYVLTVVIGGGPHPVTARIALNLVDFERGIWDAKLLSGRGR